MQTIKLIIIDDNSYFRKRLSQFLKTNETLEVVGDLSSGQDLVKTIELCQPEVVITDLALPDISGFEIIDQIKQNYPQIGCVALTMYDNDEYRQSALDAGAYAFVIKSELTHNIIRAIYQAYDAIVRGN